MSILRPLPIGAAESNLMDARVVGEDAVLLTCDPDQTHRLAALARDLAPDLLDIVPAACTVLLDGARDPDALCATMLAAEAESLTEVCVTSGSLTLDVSYDGADLEVVAGHWGCSVSEVIERHQALDFTVAFCGFAPGFAYLRGLPDEWSVPRQDSPRERVPAGSVGLAGDWCGVYPTASPGGWQLLGTTDAELWRLDREPPSLLVPGMTVRFRAV